MNGTETADVDERMQRLTAFRDIEAHVIETDEEAIEIARRLSRIFAESASDVDRSAAVPVDELTELARSGLLAIRVPKQYGGAGASYRTIAEITVLLAAASGSLGQIPQNHFHLADAIFRFGNEPQKAFFANELLAGKRLGNALSERNGKPPGSPPTTLITGPHEGRFRVTGRKIYATGALTAQWIPTTVMSPDGVAGLALIPRLAPGVTVVNDWDSLGQKGTHSGSVHLTEVEIPELYVFLPWNGFYGSGTFAPYSTLIHAAIDVGIGRGALAAFKEFINYKSRAWIAARVDRADQDQLTIYTIGKLATSIDAAEALLFRATDALEHADRVQTAQAYDRALIAVAQASAFAGEASERFCSEAFSLAGASSAANTVNLHRFWRDVRTHSIHDPARWKYFRTGNWILNGIAESQFGISSKQ